MTYRIGVLGIEKLLSMQAASSGGFHQF